MIIKFRDKRRGEHVHSHVWMGPDKDHLALSGVLVMRLDEWQWFGAALLLGAQQVSDGHPGRLTVFMPDQLEVVEGG